MDTTVDDLKNFYSSEAYSKLLHDVGGAIKLDLAGPGPDMLYVLDLKNLETSKIALADLQSVLSKDRQRFKDFLIRKNDALSQRPSEQEYPANERPDPDDRDVVIKTYAYDNYLFGHLIEFWMLKNTPNALGTYLKLRRIPKAGEYEKQLRRFYAG